MQAQQLFLPFLWSLLSGWAEASSANLRGSPALAVTWIDKTGLPTDEGEDMKFHVADTFPLAGARAWCEVRHLCAGFAYRPSDGRWFPKMIGARFLARPGTNYSQKWEGQVWHWHYILERAQIQVSTSVDCHAAVYEDFCWHQIQWATTTGILQFPDWYPGLNATSSGESFQCIIHQSHPSMCPRPCNVGCPRCYTAVSGESCWEAVHWAKTVGIHANPDWYPGLNATSSMDDFQCIVHKIHPNMCSTPCGVECPLNVTLSDSINGTIDCHAAVPGASCWDEVSWARTVGISQHPEWYPGLNATSSLESFQCIVYQSGSSKCHKPCSLECQQKPPILTSLTILHISDTHSMHRQTKLPPADIFIHSGDIADHGRDAEFGDFNEWLGSMKHLYRYIFVIPGNHDWWHANSIRQPQAAADPTAFIQQRVTNARVLHHEVEEVMGLKIWGAGWHPMSNDAASGNRYDDIPHGIDVLVTHDPPLGIFDSTSGGHWGSSHALVDAVQRTRPKVHLFGHVHEQQGEWHKGRREYEGGVTYRPNPSSSRVFAPNTKPPLSYGPEVIINGAMANQATVDHAYTGQWLPMHISGPYHLILAQKERSDWHFTLKSP